MAPLQALARIFWIYFLLLGQSPPLLWLIFRCGAPFKVLFAMELHSCNLRHFKDRCGPSSGLARWHFSKSRLWASIARHGWQEAPYPCPQLLNVFWWQENDAFSCHMPWTTGALTHAPGPCPSAPFHLASHSFAGPHSAPGLAFRSHEKGRLMDHSWNYSFFKTGSPFGLLAGQTMAVSKPPSFMVICYKFCWLSITMGTRSGIYLRVVQNWNRYNFLFKKHWNH